MLTVEKREITNRMEGEGADVMDRRTYLAGATAAAAAAIAGCGGSDRDDGGESDRDDRRDPPTPTEPDPPPPDTDAFERTVDIVAAGADPTGREPIGDALRAQAVEDTLVEFPPGRYRLAEEFIPDVSRFGMRGPDATIVPTDGNDQLLFGLGGRSPASTLVVSGFTFDFRAPDTGGRPLLARADDRVLARDLTVVGEVDVDQDLFRFDVTDPGGHGLVEGLRLPDGAVPGTGVTGVEVGDDNRGDIDFVGCHVAGFPDNGLYADLPAGRVRVTGGTFLNNGIAGVRVEADEAVVRGVHVRCDDADGAGENMRGIRLRRGASVLVEDCLVEMLEVTSSDGAVTFASELDAAVLRDSRIRVDADGVNALRIKSEPDGDRRGPFRCENLRITGAAATGASILAADARGCRIEDVAISHTGASRDGIATDNVTGSLRDVSVDVTGEPFRFDDSDLDRRDVTVSR